ncbi:unnamed protein product [Moneuplotes crassus]|uniref:Uncharacterized protein n=1 Tax=Euplotes crassus TaxID=5936 RepID=A0AAD1XSB5_EUPCR|nr:unnamed protein product [Moneuplotes crassus]
MPHILLNMVYKDSLELMGLVLLSCQCFFDHRFQLSHRRIDQFLRIADLYLSVNLLLIGSFLHRFRSRKLELPQIGSPKHHISSLLGCAYGRVHMLLNLAVFHRVGDYFCRGKTLKLASCSSPNSRGYSHQVSSSVLKDVSTTFGNFSKAHYLFCRHLC